MGYSARRKAASTLKFILQNHVVGRDKSFPEELDVLVDEFVDEMIGAMREVAIEETQRGQNLR